MLKKTNIHEAYLPNKFIYFDRFTNRNGLRFYLIKSPVYENFPNEEIYFYAIPEYYIDGKSPELFFSFGVTNIFIAGAGIANIQDFFVSNYGEFEFKKWLNEVNELKDAKNNMLITTQNNYAIPESTNGILTSPTNEEDDERLQKLAEEVILKEFYNNRLAEKFSEEYLEEKCFVPKYIFNYTYNLLNKSGYLDIKNYQLTPSGIGYYKNTLNFDLPQNKYSKTVFIAQSFSVDMKLFCDQTFEPLVKEFKLNPILIFNEEPAEPIDVEILNQIKQCRFMICDLTHSRPSVYFEAGYALARGVNIIFTCRNDHNSDEQNFDANKFKVHFDIRRYKNRKISWWSEDKTEEFKEELRNRIKNFLDIQNQTK